jgi:hypothetical protein
MIAQLFPKQKLIIFERNKSRELQLLPKILFNFLIANVMQLHAYKPRFFFGYQIPQMLPERPIIPLFQQERVRQHKQYAAALIHYVLDVLAEHFLLVVFFIIVQNVILDQKVFLHEFNQAISHPFLRRHVVAYKQIVLLISLGATFARAYFEKVRKKPEYTR